MKLLRRELNEEMLREISENYSDRLRAALDTTNQEKRDSYAAVDALKKEVVESYPEDQPEQRANGQDDLRSFEGDDLPRRYSRTSDAVRTAGGFRRFVRSPAKSAGCRAFTVRRFSRAAKRRHS